MKEYILKIKYNPETEEIDSIQEYIESDSPKIKLLIDEDSIEVPDKLAEYILKYCQDETLGLG